MTKPAAGQLTDFRPELRDALRRAAGHVPPNVGLMHVLMQATSAEEAGNALAAGLQEAQQRRDTDGMARLGAVQDLFRDNPQAFEVVRAIVDGLDHAGDRAGAVADQITCWANAFDAAARGHPEASVALYALGSPELLHAATDEVADRFDEWGLVTAETDCLDVGCGIGRLEIALAGRLRSIVGVDISGEMVAEARRRTASLPNVEIRQIGGRDLSSFTDATFDLVLTVDSFPYLVAAGGDLAATMIREAGRVLRRGGRLVILNFSYRGDTGRDRAELEAAAALAGLELLRACNGDFTLWDASTFDLRKR